MALPALLMATALSHGAAADGDDAADPLTDEARPAPPVAPPRTGLPVPTLGGRQFWGDVHHFRGWRIQQNVFTRHYRLLDPRDVRHTWGTRAHCQASLDAIAARRRLPPLQGRAVILVHGIVRSSKSMGRLASALAAPDCTVVSFDYPSTRVTITEAAEYLRQVVDSLEGIDQVDFVAQSMGGLVVRAYLQQTHAQPDPRLRRLVMMGSPHRGARLASLLQQHWLFHVVFGPAGAQLAESSDGFLATLPTPPLEFGVIAGARGTPAGFNPLIPGDDDGVVGVESALLPGACDSLLTNCLHTFLPSHGDVIAATRCFLECGSFRAGRPRAPVPVKAPTASPEDPHPDVQP
jgi:pimeloyl-ACP methyl ester carboxylesterase